MSRSRRRPRPSRGAASNCCGKEACEGFCNSRLKVESSCVRQGSPSLPLLLGVGDPPLPSWTSSCFRCLRSSATNSPRLERLREIKHADDKPGSGTESSPGITRMPAIWKHRCWSFLLSILLSIDAVMMTRYFGRVSLESTAENSSNVYIAQMRNRGGYQASPGLQDMFLDKNYPQLCFSVQTDTWMQGGSPSPTRIEGIRSK